MSYWWSLYKSIEWLTIWKALLQIRKMTSPSGGDLLSRIRIQWWQIFVYRVLQDRPDINPCCWGEISPLLCIYSTTFLVTILSSSLSTTEHSDIVLNFYATSITRLVHGDEVSCLVIIWDFTFFKGDIKNRGKWKGHLGSSLLKHGGCSTIWPRCRLTMFL